MNEEHARLLGRVDAHFERTRARHPDALRCAPGCSACCRLHLALLPLEALAIEHAVMALPPSRRAQVARQAAALEQGTSDTLCPLVLQGRCSVYAQRPLICRTHGLPLRFGDSVEVCSLNFTEGDPPADALVDAEAVNDELVALDYLVRRERAVPMSITEVVRRAVGGSGWKEKRAGCQ